VSDIANGTASGGQAENVTSASVGASALSRIRAIQSAASSEGAAAQNLQILWNVCFWSAAVIGGFALVHLGVVLLLRRLKVSWLLPQLLRRRLPAAIVAGSALLLPPGLQSSCL